MIVVDTSLIAYLLIQGEHSVKARGVLRKDPEWLAPLLWRSELRNVLALYIRQGVLSAGEALQLVREAEALMKGGEYQVESAEVLSLVVTSKCSAYDCEFVALARHLALPLVTTDRQVLAEFPGLAVRPELFCSG
ncbi:MAG TPA: type II toxin-antitoxin system VapC family toxin [Thermoanaerobaculia bacterium]|nr:type II toxin-antitoxin system VapC family toxin [Thermoanaerobaculia bacterium]